MAKLSEEFIADAFKRKCIVIDSDDFNIMELYGTGSERWAGLKFASCEEVEKVVKRWEDRDDERGRYLIFELKRIR